LKEKALLVRGIFCLGGLESMLSRKNSEDTFTGNEASIAFFPYNESCCKRLKIGKVTHLKNSLDPAQ
jgi:hypothetical protein